MANMCFNSITGDREAIKDIAKKYIDKNGDFDFEKISPLAEADRAVLKDAWGCSSIGFAATVNEDSIQFETKWLPPLGILQKLADMYRGSHFDMEYNEPGVGFRGNAVAYYAHDQVMFNDEHWEMTPFDYDELGMEYDNEDGKEMLHIHSYEFEYKGYEKNLSYREYSGYRVDAPNEEEAWKTFFGVSGEYGRPKEEDYIIKDLGEAYKYYGTVEGWREEDREGKFEKEKKESGKYYEGFVEIYGESDYLPKYDLEKLSQLVKFEITEQIVKESMVKHPDEALRSPESFTDGGDRKDGKIYNKTLVYFKALDGKNKSVLDVLKDHFEEKKHNGRVTYYDMSGVREYDFVSSKWGIDSYGVDKIEQVVIKSESYENDLTRGRRVKVLNDWDFVDNENRPNNKAIRLLSVQKKDGTEGYIVQRNMGSAMRGNVVEEYEVREKPNYVSAVHCLDSYDKYRAREVEKMKERSASGDISR